MIAQQVDPLGANVAIVDHARQTTTMFQWANRVRVAINALLASVGLTQQSTFSAGSFTADGGASSWTVALANQISFSYRVVGDTMFLSVWVQSSSLVRDGGSPVSLRVLIPGGFVATGPSIVAPALIADNTGSGIIRNNAGVVAGTASVVPSIDTTHVIVERQTGAQFANSASATGVAFSITFFVVA